MHAFYLALLGILVGLGTLAAASVLAVHQLIAQRISSRAASSIFRDRLLLIGTAIYFVASLAVLAASILLAAPHDFIPGYLGADAILQNPITAVVVSSGALGGAVLAITGISRAIRLLNPWESGRLLLARFDGPSWELVALASMPPDMTVEHILEDADGAADGAVADLLSSSAGQNPELSRRRGIRRAAVERSAASLAVGSLLDPVSDAVAIALRALESRDDEGLGRIMRGTLHTAVTYLSGRLRSTAVGKSELQAALANRLFSKGLQQISDRAFAIGHPAGGLVVCLAVADALGRESPEIVWIEAQGLIARISRQALQAGAATTLVGAIGAIQERASASMQHAEGQERFDRAARALGHLGEQVPAVFRDPAAPEVLFALDTDETTDPVYALLDAYWQIANDLETTETPINVFIYVEAMQRTGEALTDRVIKVFGDARLEHELVHLRATVARFGIASAKRLDAPMAFASAIALSAMAERAQQPYYHELPADLAGDLAEIGFLSEQHGLRVPSGPELAPWIAEKLVAHLNPQLDHLAKELLIAGRYAYADSDAVLSFIRRLASEAGRNFGLSL